MGQLGSVGLRGVGGMEDSSRVADEGGADGDVFRKHSSSDLNHVFHSSVRK